MIGRLSGIIDSTSKDSLIIDVGGVGYHVFCSGRTLTAMATTEGMVSLYIETHVREDHIHLFGFSDQYEQAWFRLLTTVQGVGARVALAMLSVIAPDALAQAIAAQDKTAITEAPGVGPKLATRIMTELKDKMGGIALGDSASLTPVVPSDGAAGRGNETNTVAADAVSALVNLGYGRSDAFGAVAQAVQRLGPDAGAEALIKDGLIELSAFEERA